METITIKIEAGDKALVLAGELALMVDRMKCVKSAFPSRTQCDNYDSLNSGTCRDHQDYEGELCERCSDTEVLATEWRQLTKQKYSIIQKLARLGTKHRLKIQPYQPPFTGTFDDLDDGDIF